MEKKLLSVFFALSLFLLNPFSGFGQCPTSVSISSDQGNTICEDTSVTFTANANNGTQPYTYQWYVNGTNVGTNSNTYTTTTLTNGQSVSVEITQANGTACNIESDGYTMTVNSKITPTVDFLIPSGTKCIGQNITFSATNTNGGTNPNYEWFVNGISVQSSTNNKLTRSFTSNETFTIKVVLTSTITCYTSQMVEVEKPITIEPDATISSSNPNIMDACLNNAITPITFNVSGSASGATVSGLPSGVTGTYNSGTFTISGSPTATGSFSYTVTTSGPCSNVSASGTITVLKDATIALSSGNSSQEVCQGEAIGNIIYAIGETGNDATVTGFPGGISGSLSGGNFTISGSSTQTGIFNYSIYATGSCGISQTLNGSITIKENLTPSVIINSSDFDNNICEGTEVVFNANVTNGGNNPEFQWKINGANSGSVTTSNTFITSTLADNDVVTVELTSSETCTTSNPVSSNSISTIVNENLPPAVSITVSDSDFCQGDSVIFTATAENGGTPSYQWKVDGVNVNGTGNTYTTNGLTNGQEVSVVMTSSETCLTEKTATSNVIGVIVNPNLTPTVSIASNDADNIICSGDTIQFTASPTNEGSSPTYEWFVDNISVGNNSATFSSNSLTNGQKLKVILTSSEECLEVSTAESNEITIEVDSPLSSISPTFDNTDLTHNNTAVCPVTDVTYKINPIDGARSYNWTYPGGWSVVSQNANTIILKAGVNATGGQITVTANNNCGDSQTLTLTVTTGTAVLVDAGPDQTVCLGTNSITLAGQIGGAISQGSDFTWAVSVTGGTLSDQNSNNTSKKLNATYTLPTSIKNNGGTITFTLSSIQPAGNCDIKTDTMVLTVLKDATISIPTNLNQTTCINAAIGEINFTITDAGTGANATGLPTGLEGTYDSGIYKISGTPTESGSFPYTVTTNGSCTTQQISASGTIIVSPDQTLDDPTNKTQEICINSAIENIVFTTNESVTNANVSGLPTGLNGTFSAGSYTISGIVTQSGSFEYTVTTSGDCVGTSQTGIIVVNPDPTINSPTNKDQEICINTALTDIQFNITSPATDASVEGLPDGVSGIFNNGIFTLSGTPIVAGTFAYTVTTVSDCADVSESGQIIVNPDPTAEINYAGDFCTSQVGSMAVNITGYTNGNFYATPSGLSIDPNNGDITPGTSEPGTYTVNYDTSSDCKTYTAETTVIINQLPSVEISYAGPFCTSDVSEYSVNFTNGVGAYEVGTFSTNQVGLDIDTNTGIISPKTSNPDIYKVSYTIPATSGCDAVVVETEVTITRLPQVSISYDTPFCNSDSTVYGVIYGSTAGDYTGGVFTGTEGLNIDAEGKISPQTSTPGVHTITYTKDTADDGCAVVEATAQIEIFEKVQITTQPVNYGTCSSNPASFEVVATGDNLSYLWYKKDAGGTFVQINGETGSILSFTNATSADAGEYHVVVSSSNGVCGSEISDPVTLNIDEDIIITKPVEDITICEDDYETLSFEYEAHANGAELSFQWIKDGISINETAEKYLMTKSGPNGDDGIYTGKLTIQNIDLNDDGIYAVEIDGPDYFTCSEATSKTFTFRVNKRPAEPVTAAVNYCLNATPQALTATKANADNDLLWYSYDAATDEYIYLGTSITPNTDIPGATSYWVTQKQPNSCESDPAELIVTVFDKPEPLATETIQFSYCFNETISDPISLIPSDGSTLNWYDAENATTALDSAPMPNTSEIKLTSYWVSQTLTSTGCESDRTKVDININQLPNINISVAEGYYAEICQGSSTKLVASGATNYIWYLDGNEIGTTSDVTVTGDSTGTFEYKVIGTNDNGCVNENVISIKVEEPSEGGTVSGPSSVCIAQNQGTLTVADFKGEIQRWESSTDGTNWTAIAQTSDTLDFQNLSGTTTFRTIVKNGVCDEIASTEIAISIDQEPVGGELAFGGFGRVIETCSNPGPNYNIPLSLSGQEGEIVSWRYKEGTATGWSTVMEGSEIFIGTTLSPALIRSLGINQSTIFEVEIASGACTPNVFSQNATLSIISSDIAPNPVTVAPGVICIEDEVTLSASTGYGSGAGFEEGGSFDFSSITNKGWRIKDSDGVETNFDSSADNGVAAIWLRTNPLPLSTASLNFPYPVSSNNWDSSAGNEGNKGFAIVSGSNPSTMETSVFNLFATDNPVLTFDQAYNLTPDSAIYVEISTDGGATYQPVPLFELIATNSTDGTSGNYASFGDGNTTTRPKNKMELDLTAYAGLDNLRIMFRYEGTRPGDVWAVDAISLPLDSTGVDMIWTDYTDPANPVIIGNNNSEQWTPTLIGWNDFEIRTRLTFDSTGATCPVVENFSTIKVFVFDQYISTAEATAGACGTDSVPLNATVINSSGTDVAGTKTLDAYEGKWEVTSSPSGYTFNSSHFSNDDTTINPVQDPTAVFTPGEFGDYTLRWVITTSAVSEDGKTLVNDTCPPTYTDVSFTIQDCAALDFDGVDDYVDLGEGYIGDYSLEAWIMPFERTNEDESKTDPTRGTIISTPNLEINMSDLIAAGVTTNNRWYHIAVDSDGKLYIDGIDSGTIGKTGSDRAFIGARWNAPNAENHFSGWIEEVRIWNGKISQENIRFTMNQRLKDSGNIGVEVDMDHPDSPAFVDLAGYYQLIADPAKILNGGYTEDLSGSPVHGKLRNMTTLQENTAPLPYYTALDGAWDTPATWAEPDVWKLANTSGINWNIVRTSNNVNSNRDISVLGLISEVNTLDMLGDIPTNESHLGVGTGKALTISHYLKLDGIIDLNGESQLLQPELSIIDNASSGHLDRDQQGKRNSYIYNYWASPVSTTGSANNGGYNVGGILLDGTNPASPALITFEDYHGAADGARTTPITISTYWLWGYTPAAANVYAEWDHIRATGSVRSGEGFTMKGTDGSAVLADGQNYTFRGKPHNNNITLSMGPNQNYLIGNPYPSAIDAYEFIKDNLKPLDQGGLTGGRNNENVFDGSLYFWDHFQEVNHILKEYIGGYAVLNLMASVPASSVDDRINNTGEPNDKYPGQYIPVSQGFLINSTTPESSVTITGGLVKFKNSQRVFEKEGASTSLFLKPETVEKKDKSKNSEYKKIRLSFSSPVGYWRQILVGAVPFATDGFDLGYDAHLFDDNSEDMYWLQGDNNLVIQAVTDFNKDRILPLGVRIKEEKEFTIRIDTVENAPTSLKIYLNDKLNDSIHDLRAGPYVSTSEPGFIHDRFKIIFFKEEPPVVEEPIVGVPGEEGPIIEVPETDFTTLSIKHAHNLREVQIMNPDELIITSVYLFDLNGNLIENYTNIPKNKIINLRVRNYSSGVYLLKVYAEGKIISKKIIISN